MNRRNVSKQLNRFDTAETLVRGLARTVSFNLVKELVIRTSNSMALNMFRINHKSVPYLIQIEHVKIIEKYVQNYEYCKIDEKTFALSGEIIA